MNIQPDRRQLNKIKAAFFLLCLLPLGRLIAALWANDLGAEPAEFIQRWTGSWTFNLLLITLCISPLRAITQLHWLLRLRRLFGLFTFFYATLHFLSFIGFEHAFAVDKIALAIAKQPYVTVGFAALLLLTPLAATSNAWAIRQLGGRKWQELHRNIYLIAILASIHYFWLTKPAALLWPSGYAIALGGLLWWRVQERRRKAILTPGLQSTKPLKFFKKRPG